MRIIIIGEDKFSAAGLEAILEEKNEVPLVLTPHGNPDARILKKIAEKNGVPVQEIHNPNTPEIEKMVTELQPELLFLIHYNRIIKHNIYSIPQKGTINIHPSRLPDYRGQTPQHWAVIHGEKEIGLTTHFVDNDVDSGDIICQEIFKINDDTYIAEIQQMLYNSYKNIIVETLKRIEDPTFIPRKQIITSEKIFPLIKPENCEIDKNQSVTEIYNRIRALSLPYFGAPYQQYRFFKAHILPPIQEKEIREKYSEIGFYPHTISGNIFVAKDGILEIEWFDEI